MPLPSEQLAVETSFGWRALPASASPVNGHVMIQIGSGSLRPVGDAARDVTVLVDVSPSMKDRVALCNAVVGALKELPSTDRKALVLFANRAKLFQGEITPETVSSSVDLEGNSLGAGTDMLEGILTALQSESGSRSTRMIVISDGMTSNEQNCLTACQEADVPVTVLGTGRKCNRKLLTEMAESTNGHFREARNAGVLSRALEQELSAIPATVSRDTRLIITVADGVKVNGAYRLAPAARNLGKPVMHGNTVEIPLGEIREGETIRIALDVLAPSRAPGTVELASGRIETAGGLSTSLPPIQVEFSKTATRPERNPKMRATPAEVQWAASRKR